MYPWSKSDFFIWINWLWRYSFQLLDSSKDFTSNQCFYPTALDTNTCTSLHVPRHLISFPFGANKYYNYVFFCYYALIIFHFFSPHNSIYLSKRIIQLHFQEHCQHSKARCEKLFYLFSFQMLIVISSSVKIKIRVEMVNVKFYIQWHIHFKK